MRLWLLKPATKICDLRRTCGPAATRDQNLSQVEDVQVTSLGQFTDHSPPLLLIPPKMSKASFRSVESVLLVCWSQSWRICRTVQVVLLATLKAAPSAPMFQVLSPRP